MSILLSLGFSLQLTAQFNNRHITPPEKPIQADGKETLEWVIERTERIEKLINSAMISHDQSNLILRLLEVYVEFDAISLVGLYCAEAQAAAEMGRETSNLLNFRGETDMNTMLLRAIKAKEQSMKVRNGSLLCLSMYTDSSTTSPSFAPNKAIIEEASWAILDLEDGLASNDFHIFSQKTEHAIRLIEEIDHIAGTLSNCADVIEEASAARTACRNALASPNWVAINKEAAQAITHLKNIQQASCIFNSEK